jgi:rRNA maturation protein Nop10
MAAVSQYIDRVVTPGGEPDTDLLGQYISPLGLTPTPPTKCPSYFTVGTCEHGKHQFAKELYCGREWCPVCGQDKSVIHMRRFSRWLPKIYQCRSIGYFVLTIPESARERFRTKSSLNMLTKRVIGDKSTHIEGIFKPLGFNRGLIRWHYFGDKSTIYNPHLNVIVDAGRITPETLHQVKNAWAEILGVDQAVVQYSFTRMQGKMVHILKYVTRATFHEASWDERLVGELYNFRNMRSWGTWTDAPVWQLTGKSQYEHIELLSQGLCPTCGGKLTWSRAINIHHLSRDGTTPLGAGYYQLPDIPPGIPGCQESPSKSSKFKLSLEGSYLPIGIVDKRLAEWYAQHARMAKYLMLSDAAGIDN